MIKKWKGQKMKFRLKTGIHIQNGKTFVPGEVVNSDKDLVKLFKNKFENVGTKQDQGTKERQRPIITTPPPSQGEVLSKEEPLQDLKEKETKNKPKSQEINVSSKFSKVLEGTEFSVVVKDKKFFVKDDDGIILNQEGLSTKKETNNFITSFFSDDLEDEEEIDDQEE
jgi:hypothetical protein